MRAIKKLLEIIAYLRSKDGCAWDKKQTPFASSGRSKNNLLAIKNKLSSLR